MAYINDDEYRRLLRNLKYKCPKCGALEEYKITSHDGFVYSKSPNYHVQCRKCKHQYTVPDMETG